MNKKGQIFEQFGGMAIGVVTLVIILVVSFMIMSQAKDTGIGLISATSYDNTTQKTVTNGTTTVFTECIPDEALTITQLLNGSGANAIALEAGNYSISGNIVTLSTDTLMDAAVKNISYSCKNPDTAYNSTSSLQNATATIPGWVSIIIITAIGSILIGMVMMFRRN